MRLSEPQLAAPGILRAQRARGALDALKNATVGER